MREDSIVNASCRIGRQSVVFRMIKGQDCLDKANRPYGYQIICIFIRMLILFSHMGNQPQITFNENLLCLLVAFFILLEIVFFFFDGKWFWKCLQRKTSKQIYIIIC